MPMNPFLGIKEANQHDQRPQSLKDSNKLYGKYWKQGFFAMVGERHPGTTGENASLLFKLTDPTLNLLYQLIFLDDDETQGHLGLPDMLNPLVWASLLAAICTAPLLKDAANDQKDTPARVKAGIIGTLLLIPTVPLVLAQILTTYLLDLAKVVLAVVSVTVSSAVWYPAKLATLPAGDDEYERLDEEPGL